MNERRRGRAMSRQRVETAFFISYRFVICFRIRFHGNLFLIELFLYWRMGEHNGEGGLIPRVHKGQEHRAQSAVRWATGVISGGGGTGLQ